MQIQLDELAEFLFGKKGALDIFLKIDREEGNTRSELYDMVDISAGTGKKRVQEAIELELFEEKPPISSDQHANTKLTCLTEEGQKLRDLLSKFDVEENFNQCLEANKQLNGSISNFIAGVQDEEAEDTSVEMIESVPPSLLEEEYHVHPFFGHKYD